MGGFGSRSSLWFSWLAIRSSRNPSPDAGMLVIRIAACTGWCYRAHVMSSALHTPPPSDHPTCTREPSEGCVPVTSAVRMPPALARSAGHLEPRTLSCWTHEEPPGGSRRNEGVSTLNTCTQPPRGRAGHSLTYSSLVHGNKMTSTHPHIFRHFPKKKRDFSWGWPCPSDPAMIGLLLSAPAPLTGNPKRVLRSCSSLPSWMWAIFLTSALWKSKVILWCFPFFTWLQNDYYYWFSKNIYNFLMLREEFDKYVKSSLLQSPIWVGTSSPFITRSTVRNLKNVLLGKDENQRERTDDFTLFLFTFITIFIVTSRGRLFQQQQ